MRLLLALLLIGVIGCSGEERPPRTATTKPITTVADSHDNSKLTICSDCGGKVSKRALACPHCGAPASAVTDSDGPDPLPPTPSVDPPAADPLPTASVDPDAADPLPAPSDSSQTDSDAGEPPNARPQPTPEELNEKKFKPLLGHWQVDGGRHLFVDHGRWVMVSAQGKQGDPQEGAISIVHFPSGELDPSALSAERNKELGGILDELSDVALELFGRFGGKPPGGTIFKLRAKPRQVLSKTLVITTYVSIVRGKPNEAELVESFRINSKLTKGKTARRLKRIDAKRWPSQEVNEQKATDKTITNSNNECEAAEPFTLKGHSDTVCSVSFSPDGKRIVSGSRDKTLKVWDAQTGKETLTLKGHTSPVRSVSFSPDGKRIVSGSHDKTVKVWDISSLATSK